MGRTFLSAAFDLDFDFCNMHGTKINFKSGGQECPSHMGESDHWCSSKQLHLQEVTVDSRYENYTMTKRKKEAGIRAVFDDESGTLHECEWDNPGEGSLTPWTL